MFTEAWYLWDSGSVKDMEVGLFSLAKEATFDETHVAEVAREQTKQKDFLCLRCCGERGKSEEVSSV